jgi:PhnB protein
VHSNSTREGNTDMSKSSSYIPQGLVPLIPQVVTKDAATLLPFLEAAFGAKVGGQMPWPNGKGVMHAHLFIEGSPLYVAEPFGQAAPTKTNLFVYLKDVDAAVERAEKAGAKVLAPAKDMPWGDRWALVEDPFGNQWQLATHVEDVPPEEMMKRMGRMAGGQP